MKKRNNKQIIHDATNQARTKERNEALYLGKAGHEGSGAGDMYWKLKSAKAYAAQVGGEVKPFIGAGRQNETGYLIDISNADITLSPSELSRVNTVYSGDDALTAYDLVRRGSPLEKIVNAPYTRPTPPPQAPAPDLSQFFEGGVNLSESSVQGLAGALSEAISRSQVSSPKVTRPNTVRKDENLSEAGIDDKEMYMENYKRRLVIRAKQLARLHTVNELEDLQYNESVDSFERSAAVKGATVLRRLQRRQKTHAKTFDDPEAMYRSIERAGKPYHHDRLASSMRDAALKRDDSIRRQAAKVASKEQAQRTQKELMYSRMFLTADKRYEDMLSAQQKVADRAEVTKGKEELYYKQLLLTTNRKFDEAQKRDTEKVMAHLAGLDRLDMEGDLRGDFVEDARRKIEEGRGKSVLREIALASKPASKSDISKALTSQSLIAQRDAGALTRKLLGIEVRSVYEKEALEKAAAAEAAEAAKKARLEEDKFNAIDYTRREKINILKGQSLIELRNADSLTRKLLASEVRAVYAREQAEKKAYDDMVTSIGKQAMANIEQRKKDRYEQDKFDAIDYTPREKVRMLKGQSLIEQRKAGSLERQLLASEVRSVYRAEQAQAEQARKDRIEADKFDSIDYTKAEKIRMLKGQSLIEARKAGALSRQLIGAEIKAAHDKEQKAKQQALKESTDAFKELHYSQIFNPVKAWDEAHQEEAARNEASAAEEAARQKATQDAATERRKKELMYTDMFDQAERRDNRGRVFDERQAERMAYKEDADRGAKALRELSESAKRTSGALASIGGAIKAVVEVATAAVKMASANAERELFGAAGAGMTRGQYAGLIDELNLGTGRGGRIAQTLGSEIQNTWRSPSSLGSSIASIATATALGGGQHIDYGAYAHAKLSGNTTALGNIILKAKDTMSPMQFAAAFPDYTDLAVSDTSKLEGTRAFRDGTDKKAMQALHKFEQAAASAIGGSLPTALKQGEEGLVKLGDAATTAAANLAMITVMTLQDVGMSSTPKVGQSRVGTPSKFNWSVIPKPDSAGKVGATLGSGYAYGAEQRARAQQLQEGRVTASSAMSAAMSGGLNVNLNVDPVVMKTSSGDTVINFVSKKVNSAMSTH